MSSSPPNFLTPLATLTPPSNTRTWHSTPHPTQPLLATACADKTVRVYSLRTFAQDSIISGGHKRSVRSCAWKPAAARGESVLATGSFDASAAIWKRWDRKFRGDGPVGEGVEGVKVDGGDEVDFTRGLAGGNTGDDEEDEEWRLEVILDGHDSEIKSLAFCPTAPLLATCSRDKSVWVWEELDGDNFETMAVLQDHEGDVKCVAWHPEEQLLASGSYDDNVRLWREDVDDWACCTLLTGHKGTVWWVEFEGTQQIGKVKGMIDEAPDRTALLEERVRAGSRLLTCSDDFTIRVWRRVPKPKAVPPPTGQGRMPSIWKNRDFEEEWIEEAKFPQLHDRPVYSVSWSRKTGRVVSAGSDGKIIVYEEHWRSGADKDTVMSDATHAHASAPAAGLTEWVAIAEIENAHDVFEINHVIWAPRADKDKQYDDEEVIVSTGDDGEVKLWTLTVHT